LTDPLIYVLPDAKIKNKTYFKSAQTAIKDHLYRNQEVEIFINPDLKIYSRVGEAEDDFRVRCQQEADNRADKDAAKLRDVLSRKLDRINALLGGRTTTRTITSGIRRSQSKGRMAGRAQERVRTAENRYADLMEDRQELEDTLTEDLYEIQDEWSEKAENIESQTVGLEKTDISIDDVALIWIPVD